MPLVIVILLLLFYLGRAIIKIFERNTPPIEDIYAHTRYMMSLPDEKARRAFLKRKDSYKFIGKEE